MSGCNEASASFGQSNAWTISGYFKNVTMAARHKKTEAVILLTGCVRMCVQVRMYVRMFCANQRQLCYLGLNQPMSNSRLNMQLKTSNGVHSELDQSCSHPVLRIPSPAHTQSCSPSPAHIKSCFHPVLLTFSPAFTLSLIHISEPTRPP